MSLEASIVGYAALGAGSRFLDKMRSVTMNGDFRRYSERKETYKALDFVYSTYEKKNWDALKKDPQFLEAFLKTKEYFAERVGSLDQAVEPQNNTKFGSFYDRLLYVGTKEFWTQPWISKISERTKLVASLLVPFGMDLKYAASAATDWGTEFMETPAEFGALYLGMSPIGRGIDVVIDKVMHRYDRKLSRVEKKILLDEDIKAALAEEISTEIPGLKKPEPKQQKKQAEVKEVAPPSRDEILERLKKL
jgi:hypothetical protein